MTPPRTQQQQQQQQRQHHQYQSLLLLLLWLLLLLQIRLPLLLLLNYCTPNTKYGMLTPPPFLYFACHLLSQFFLSESTVNHCSALLFYLSCFVHTFFVVPPTAYERNDNAHTCLHTLHTHTHNPTKKKMVYFFIILTNRTKLACT